MASGILFLIVYFGIPVSPTLFKPLFFKAILSSPSVSPSPQRASGRKCFLSLSPPPPPPRPARLPLGREPLWVAREHGRLPDVVQPEEEHHHALQAHANATVGGSTEPGEVRGRKQRGNTGMQWLIQKGEVNGSEAANEGILVMGAVPGRTISLRKLVFLHNSDVKTLMWST